MFSRYISPPSSGLTLPFQGTHTPSFPWLFWQQVTPPPPLSLCCCFFLLLDFHSNFTWHAAGTISCATIGSLRIPLHTMVTFPLSQFLSGLDWPTSTSGWSFHVCFAQLAPPPSEPEDGCDMFLQNVGLSPNHTALQPRKPYSWS
jgi:hypothetical protein